MHYFCQKSTKKKLRSIVRRRVAPCIVVDWVQLHNKLKNVPSARIILLIDPVDNAAGNITLLCTFWFIPWSLKCIKSDLSITVCITMNLLCRPISSSDRIPDRFCVISMEFLSLNRRRSSSRNVPQRR